MFKNSASQKKKEPHNIRAQIVRNILTIIKDFISSNRRNINSTGKYFSYNILVGVSILVFSSFLQVFDDRKKGGVAKATTIHLPATRQN